MTEIASPLKGPGGASPKRQQPRRHRDQQRQPLPTDVRMGVTQCPVVAAAEVGVDARRTPALTLPRASAQRRCQPRKRGKRASRRASHSCRPRQRGYLPARREREVCGDTGGTTRFSFSRWHHCHDVVAACVRQQSSGNRRARVALMRSTIVTARIWAARPAAERDGRRRRLHGRFAHSPGSRRRTPTRSACPATSRPRPPAEHAWDAERPEQPSSCRGLRGR